MHSVLALPLLFCLPIYGLSSCRMPYECLINHGAVTRWMCSKRHNQITTAFISCIQRVYILHFLSIGTLICCWCSMLCYSDVRCPDGTLINHWPWMSQALRCFNALKCLVKKDSNLMKMLSTSKINLPALCAKYINLFFFTWVFFVLLF